MRSFLCENLCSESFQLRSEIHPGRRQLNKGDAGRPGDSEIELLTDPVIGNIFYPVRKPRDVLWGCCFVVRALRKVSGNGSEMKVPDPTLD
jgi:hypothetical protein